MKQVQMWNARKKRSRLFLSLRGPQAKFGAGLARRLRVAEGWAGARLEDMC
jgi:hypothetical protein